MDMLNTRGLSFLQTKDGTYETATQIALFSSDMPADVASIPFDYNDWRDIARNSDMIFKCTTALNASDGTMTFENQSQESVGIYQFITSGLLRNRKLIAEDLTFLGEPQGDAWMVPAIARVPHNVSTYSLAWGIMHSTNLVNSHNIAAHGGGRISYASNYGTDREEGCTMLELEFFEEIRVDALHMVGYTGPSATVAARSDRMRIEYWDEAEGAWKFYSGPGGYVDNAGNTEMSFNVVTDSFVTLMEADVRYQRHHIDLSSDPITTKKIRLGNERSWYMGGIQVITRQAPTVRTEQSATMKWGLVVDRNFGSDNFGGTAFIFDVGGLNSDAMLQLVTNTFEFTKIHDLYAHSEYPIIDHFKLTFNPYPNVVE